MKCGINAVIVVNNNHSLNQEQGGVEAVYGGRTPGSDELWLFPDADFAKMAESMGCFGITVNKPSELASALDQAFASGSACGRGCENACGRDCARGRGCLRKGELYSSAGSPCLALLHFKGRYLLTNACALLFGRLFLALRDS